MMLNRMEQEQHISISIAMRLNVRIECRMNVNAVAEKNQRIRSAQSQHITFLASISDAIFSFVKN